MSQFVDIDHSYSRRDAVAPDTDRCVDLYFPAVENLLHRLAETQIPKQPAVQAKRLGARKMAAMCAVCLLGLPGRVIAPGALRIDSAIAGGRPVRIAAEIAPVSVKADRLPLIGAVTDANYFNDANYFDEAKLRDDDDAIEQPALRGSVEDTVLAVSATQPAPAARRKLRHGPQAAFAAAPAETPEPAPPRSRSLLDRLFSVFVPEFSQPPSQRQT